MAYITARVGVAREMVQNREKRRCCRTVQLVPDFKPELPGLSDAVALNERLAELKEQVRPLAKVARRSAAPAVTHNPCGAVVARQPARDVAHLEEWEHVDAELEVHKAEYVEPAVHVGPERHGHIVVEQAVPTDVLEATIA